MKLEQLRSAEVRSPTHRRASIAVAADRAAAAAEAPKPPHAPTPPPTRHIRRVARVEALCDVDDETARKRGPVAKLRAFVRCRLPRPSLPDDMRHQKQQFSPEKPPPPERVPTARELLQAARNVQRERDSILADATAKRNAAEAFLTQLARELASLGKTLRPRSRPTLFASNSA